MNSIRLAKLAGAALFAGGIGLAASAAAAATAGLSGRVDASSAPAVNDAIAVGPALLDGGYLAVRFTVIEDAYVYTERVEVLDPSGAPIRGLIIPPGTMRQDAEYGRVHTSTGSFDVRAPWRRPPPATITVRHQGCHVSGLCYPPQVTVVDVLGTKTK